MSSSAEFYRDDRDSPVNQNHEQLIDSGDTNVFTNSDNESHGGNLTESPNGSKYWVPDVTGDFKPVLDTLFNSLEEAERMYNRYASEAGFSTRKSTTFKNKLNLITVRYIVCNKAGVPRKKKSVDTLTDDVHEVRVLKRRNSNHSVTDCNAGIKLRLVDSSSVYQLYSFEELHNHPMESAANKHFSRTARQLSFEQQDFVHKLSMSNIGPTVAHRIQVSLKGGYDKVRGTKVDYKNFRRDLNGYIGDNDARMVVDMLNSKKKHLPNFSFDYLLDNNELGGIFWADDVAKFNYSELGHVLAFDATFRTNKYGMVFVPFTGVDNHYKCVTFGAALLKNETVASYVWLLEAFLKAHVTQPKLVITDQCPSMKQAVPTVFNEAHHRFCMWHIMTKLPVKIIGDNFDNDEIRRRLHKLVWNVYIGKDEFEKRWHELIEEFRLQGNKWLEDMFKLREHWIPSYFKHHDMSCLMKTTSRAESSNSMFRIVSRTSNTLVQFMLCFESAMEMQRYEYQKLDHDDLTTTPTLSTPLCYERQAATAYTRPIFRKIQKEIYTAVYSCTLKTTASDESANVYRVKHFNKQDKIIGEFKVIYEEDEANVTCSCNLIGRLGYLCRHVFCVFKHVQLQQIPDKYILCRWKSNLLPRHLINSTHRYGREKDSNLLIKDETISRVESCMLRLRSCTDIRDEFVTRINELTSEFEEKVPYAHSKSSNKEAIFERIYGRNAPSGVQVYLPTGIRTKGCGTSKRLKGPAEKAKERIRKATNTCHVCQKEGHNSRTCELLKTRVETSSKRKRN